MQMCLSLNKQEKGASAERISCRGQYLIRNDFEHEPVEIKMGFYSLCPNVILICELDNSKTLHP